MDLPTLARLGLAERLVSKTLTREARVQFPDMAKFFLSSFMEMAAYFEIEPRGDNCARSSVAVMIYELKQKVERPVTVAATYSRSFYHDLNAMEQQQVLHYLIGK